MLINTLSSFKGVGWFGMPPAHSEHSEQFLQEPAAEFDVPELFYCFAGKCIVDRITPDRKPIEDPMDRQSHLFN